MNSTEKVLKLIDEELASLRVQKKVLETFEASTKHEDMLSQVLLDIDRLVRGRDALLEE